MSKTPRVVVLQDDDQPIHPQLVGVTIRWVETDRAYRYTFFLTFTAFLVAGGLTALGTPASVTLLGTLGNLIGHALVRAYVRRESRRELQEMKRRLGFDQVP